MVIHKQIYIDTGLGAEINTTLCGRSAEKQWDKNDGINCSPNDDEVTCKFCLKKLKDKTEPNKAQGG